MDSDALPKPTSFSRFRPAAEGLATLVLIISLSASYLILAGGSPGQSLLTPPLVALLLVANLIPAIILMVLFGRRLARGRAMRSAIGSDGRMHVRLVGLFSVMAAIPTLVMVIFASLLFQYGFDFWYSAKARNILGNASKLAQVYYKEKQQGVISEVEVMAGDLGYNLYVAPIESEGFVYNFGAQVYRRELSEGAILRIMPGAEVQSLALVNPYNRPAENWVPRDVVVDLLAKQRTIFRDSGNRLEAVTPIPGHKNLFLYATRVYGVGDTAALAQTRQLSGVMKDYNNLLDRSRVIQLGFHAALFVLSLIIIGIAVGIALSVADRLSQPVSALVAAAQKVTAGDLSARVPETPERDELGTLGNAFNQMTGTLQAQRDDLIDINRVSERRRALIEAVLSGVTAGVVAVNPDLTVRIINESAAGLLNADRATAAGRPLAEIASDLADFIASGERVGVIGLNTNGGVRTLAIQAVSDELGHVLTFDDITQQLSDQRRAAWSDVARRVAHEIKNPLTPIQLAAERLKRRLAKGEQIDVATSERLTDTIIRQVGDLRRMVDEFSSFARMPKPVFRDESLLDICRQAIFLHEVGHPSIQFALLAPDPAPYLVCDRRQLGQAITNIIKNGIEAIEQNADDTAKQIEVRIEAGETLTITFADTGIGLPVERDRIVEPYMTTRRSGTGLGLAIVTKIVEEHCGSLSFADNPGGGTIVTLQFDTAALKAMADQAEFDDHDDRAPTMLTPAGVN